MMNNNGGAYLAVLSLLILSTGIVLIGVQPAEAQEEQDVRLYLRNTQSGSGTRLSTRSPGGSAEGATMIDEQTLEFELEYPLTYDVDISGGVESGTMVILFHLEIPVSPGGDSVLEAFLYMDPASGSSEEFAGTVFETEDLSGGDLLIPFNSNSGHSLDEGSTIRLVLTFSQSNGIPLGLVFSSPSTQSYLEFKTTVFQEDAVGIKAMDGQGNQVEEVIPYGPKEAREITFSASVRDIFGANDVSSIMMIMLSSVDSVIFNTSTDEPDPSGGEPETFFNYTFEIPEGTPTDTYTITATAESYTGATSEASMELVVAPGLFLSLDDDEIGLDAGDVAVFSMDVLNGGDGVDRVSFKASSGSGWTIDVPADIEIDGGESEILEFKVFVPLGAQKYDIDEVTLTASSRNAEKDYSVDAIIEVLSSASCGMEPIGKLSKSVLAGNSLIFEVRVINLMNETREFEMSAEDLPISWEVGYDAEGGGTQGSLFKFEINESGESIVSITIQVSDSGPFGRNVFSIYLKAKGEIDKKYLYLTANVVDQTKDVVELSTGTNRKTASRTGTGYPVTYGKVYFSMKLYNPTLEGLEIDIVMDAPLDWDVEYDYDDIDLDPGDGSSWNLSIIPNAGAAWQGGSPYLIDVEIDAGNQGEFSQRLEVVIPKVTIVNAEKEWDTLGVTIGDVVPFNITFKNRGNHPEGIDVTLELPTGLSMNYTQMSISSDPGDSSIVRGELTIGDVEKTGPVSFKLLYETSKGTTTLDYTLTVSEKEETQGQDFLFYIAIGAGVVIAIAVAFLLYLKFGPGKKGSSKKVSRQEPPKRSGGVTVTAEPPRTSR
ncbi:MAG: hypothetical protein U9R75_05705, partial [Candidatus Thermoplasmatota archaeon]|nr:hypothetical protein [Candidatus Thermoplasmatota archaeon]